MESGARIGFVGVHIVLFFVKIMAFPIGLMILPLKRMAHTSHQEKRHKAMESQARELDFRFEHDDSYNLARTHHFLGYQLGGSNHFALNVMTGEFNGRAFFVCDYHYMPDGRLWWWPPSWERHDYVSYVCLNMEKPFPALAISAESNGIFSKIAEIFGGGDIDFESHAFSERYDVRCKDKKFAYDFCNAQMIDYLLDQPIIPIAIDKKTIHIGFGDVIPVGQIKRHVDHVQQVRTLMPDYLFA